MSPANRYEDLLYRCAWIVMALGIALGALLWRAFIVLPEPFTHQRDDKSLSPSWPDVPAMASCDWMIFQSRIESIPVNGGSLAKQFRLAGTFFAYGGGLEDSRKAILDDLENKTQLIVSEQEEIGDVRVVRIFRDRVVLRVGTGEEELWLSFSRAAGRRKTISVASDSKYGLMERTHGAMARFGGKRVGERRWVFKRKALLDYYRQLRDEPERLVNVFDSLKPLYDRGNKITGYRVGVEGESDFFEAVGLREGDIIRSVNTMAMTSRRRAEYFISEFVQDRANAFILDIERARKPEKLIYQVR